MIQNFISKLSPKEKKIFYAAIIFVLVAFLDRLFIGPATSRLKTLDEEIEQQKGVIRGDLRLLNYKDKILGENETLSGYYSSKPQSEEEIIASFLKKIEILASESKVNLVRVSPSEAKQKKGFIEYQANLECDGTPENITKFIYAIDTSADLLKAVKLNMNPKKAGSDEIAVSLVITKVIVDDEALKEASKLTKDRPIVRKPEVDPEPIGQIKVEQSTEAISVPTLDPAGSNEVPSLEEANHELQK